jgi:hypothetical protein
MRGPLCSLASRFPFDPLGYLYLVVQSSHTTKSSMVSLVNKEMRIPHLNQGHSFAPSSDLAVMFSLFGLYEKLWYNEGHRLLTITAFRLSVTIR